MKKLFTKLFFPIIGFLSLLWFLIRVIPKPSRAAYPCMKAAAPVATSFIIYLLGIFSSVIIFKRAGKFLSEAKYFLFTISILLGLGIGLFSWLHTHQPVYAKLQDSLEGPNLPMGTGVGINPGRVVWIHDPDATDENMKNRSDDYWYQDHNTDQAVVNSMVSRALRLLTGKNSDIEAWDALFRYYNQNHGKGDVGYKDGEKIVIKINLNSGCSGTDNDRWNYKTIDTSPQVVHAVLDQLVNKAGVPQANIGFGDPGRNVDNIFWNKFHSEFPDVKYWGDGTGRTAILRSNKKEMFTSDGTLSDWLPKCYLEADYMINIPVFKKHHRAGISLTSKNHFGTFVPFSGSAFHWHFSLPCSEGGADVNHGDYGQYRCFVDIMGHKDIGGKTMLYLIDGLWSSTNWAHPPIKWAMAPFNNDYPSSIFMSQDPVAIESVGFDFLYEEFDEDHPTEGAYDPSDNKGPFPHYAGVDDFLHQAADSKNWPAATTYDPEGDGTPLPSSMGTHEHWNNATDKKYSRNLGLDKGIELVSNFTTDIQEHDPLTVHSFTLYQNYPNPFNASTQIRYRLFSSSSVHLDIYNANGQKIRTLVNDFQQSGQYVQHWDGFMDNGNQAASGVYMYKIIATNNNSNFEESKKMVLVK